MPGSLSRQPLVTSVSIKRPLTTGFRLLFTLVILLTLASAGLAWHSEQEHKRAKQSARDLNKALAEMRTTVRAASEQEQLLSEQLRQQQAVLDGLMGGDAVLRQRWLAERVAASVAVAEQALLVSRNPQSARQALQQADILLAAQPETVWQPLRRALQQDMLVLASISTPDVPGIYLRLQGIGKRLATLDLPREVQQRAPADTAPARQVTEAAPGSTMTRLWDAGVEHFQRLIVIRHYDQPVQPVLDDARRQLVRDQYALKLSQAELALLRGETVLFRAVLEGLSVQLQQDYAALPHSTLKPLLNELAALQAEDVRVPMPELSTRAALDVLLPASRGVL